MTGAVPVVAHSRRYRAAVAELPTGALSAEDREGAVVVVAGEGEWWTALLEAQAAGALAVVVERPHSLATTAAAELAGAVTIPVAVERTHARPDAIAAAALGREGNPATLVGIECAASRGQLEVALRDSLRWAAVLAGGPLRTTRGGLPRGGGVALLEALPATGVPVPVTLGARLLPGDGRQPLLRITALGEVRSEVEMTGGPLALRTTTSTVRGSTVAPLLYEDAARSALRRALEAACTGAVLADLGELLEDQYIVAGLMDEHNQG